MGGALTRNPDAARARGSDPPVIQEMRSRYLRQSQIQIRLTKPERTPRARLEEAIILHTSEHAYTHGDWITVLPLGRLWASNPMTPPL
jgi:hypothetical protein